MFIQTEDTPNPETLKFMPGLTVLNKGTVDFSNKEASKVSPLASRLFNVDGVSRVFLGLDFINIELPLEYKFTFDNFSSSFRFALNSPTTPINKSLSLKITLKELLSE